MNTNTAITPASTKTIAPITVGESVIPEGTDVLYAIDGGDALVRVVGGRGVRMPLALAQTALAALVVTSHATVEDLLDAGFAPSRVAENDTRAPAARTVTRPGHGTQAGVDRPATELSYRATDSFVTEAAVASCKTAKELCDRAGLGWNVSRRAITVEGGASGASDFVSIVRDDTNAVLTVRSSGFEVQQPHEAFAPLESLVAAGATFRGAGSFRGGKTIWAQVNLGEHEVVDGDGVKMFAHVRDTYDGHRAWSLQVGSIRVVCANTLMHACAAGEMLARSGHNAGLRSTVENAAEALAALRGMAQRRVEEYRRLAGWKMNRDAVEALIAATLPRPDMADKVKADAAWRRQCADVMELLARGRGVEIEGVMGTGWGALNGVTEWADHTYAAARKADLVVMEQRIHEGCAARVKEAAFDWLLDHCPTN